MIIYEEHIKVRAAMNALEKLKKHFWTEDSRAAYISLLPSVIVFLVFIAFPFFYSLFLSFHKWAILTPGKPFVGLANYRDLFISSDFWNAVINTVKYSAGVIPGTTLGLTQK